MIDEASTMRRLSIPTLLPCLLFATAQYAHAARKTPSDYLVQGLEEIEPAFAEFPGRMYAGLIPLTKREEDGSFMFWLYEPDSCTVPDSMVIWLQGGPGCTSFGGMLFENAPITTPHYRAGFFGMTENEPLVPNNYSWTKATTMLYVEQPAGTGFSSGTPPETEDDVSRDFYHFLQNFYSVFTDLRDKRLFFFGESYAGMYVPSIAHKIHQENKEGKHPQVNLAGIALGNGWIDVTVQGPTVIDHAWWHGMIDTTTKDALHAQWDQCSKMGDMPEPYHPFTVPDECGIVWAVLTAAGAGTVSWGAPNQYDVTTWDIYPMIFSHNGTFERFFNNPKVRDILHAPRKYWLECIPGEGRRRLKRGRFLQEREKLLLDDDRPISMLPYMAELLDDAGIHVVVYNGDRDLSACAQGSELLLDRMDWSGSDDWHDPYKTRRGVWMVDNYVAGYSRPLKNLEFVVVYNSGHLVPLNQPKNALNLLNRVLQSKSFVDKELPVLLGPEGGTKKKISMSSQQKDISKGAVAIVAAICGFIAGIGTVLCYSSMQITKRYERLGDVEQTLS